MPEKNGNKVNAPVSQRAVSTCSPPHYSEHSLCHYSQPSSLPTTKLPTESPESRYSSAHQPKLWVSMVTRQLVSRHSERCLAIELWIQLLSHNPLPSHLLFPPISSYLQQELMPTQDGISFWQAIKGRRGRERDEKPKLVHHISEVRKQLKWQTQCGSLFLPQEGFYLIKIC